MRFKIINWHLLSLIPGTLGMMLFLNASGSIGKDGYRFTLFDDAMISMGYAKTLASTGSLVWFDGAQKIEGFTNLLWTLWMTFIHFSGLEASSASLAVSLSSFLLLILTSLTAGYISNIILNDMAQKNSVLYSSVISGCIPFLFPLSFWSLRGMETGLLSATLLFAIYSSLTILSGDNLESKRNRYAVFLGLTAIIGVSTRLDFIIPAGFILGYTYYFTKISSVRKTLFILASILASVTCVILLWQFKYYGEIFPNTYYLKMTGYPILERLERGLFSSAKFAPLILATTIAYWFTRKIMNFSVFKNFVQLSLGCILIIAAYSTWVGGDAWEQFGINRYFSVALPILMILVPIFFFHFFGNQPNGRISILISSILIVLLTPLMLAIKTNPTHLHFPRAFYLYILVFFAAGVISLSFIFIKIENRFLIIPLAALLWVLFTANATPAILTLRSGDFFTVTDDYKKTIEGYEIKAATKPGARVAVSWAGAPGYYSERYMIDLLGKSDRYIAHSQPVRNLSEDAWNRDFYPGHNKFDYSYSIGQLNPDIVVDLVSDFNLNKVGYLEYCTASGRSLYVKVDSKLVDFDQLLECENQ